jgi:hypothetical protein
VKQDADKILAALRKRFPHCEVEVDQGDEGRTSKGCIACIIRVYIKCVDADISVIEVYGDKKIGLCWIENFKSESIKSVGHDLGEFVYKNPKQVVDKLVKGVKGVQKYWKDFEDEEDAALADWAMKRSVFDPAVSPTLAEEISE